MRTLTLGLAALAACSNAADPSHDAPLRPVDASLIDAYQPDAPPALRILVVNEVAAGETPDWFEVVNATQTPVQLSDFVYVDVKGDFVKAKAFPAMMLGPGAYYAQDVDDVTSGFKLGSDEEIWVYRMSDQRLSDGADWNEGESPSGGSYARSPTIFGPFMTTTNPTKGAANP
jgi:hypothetical protein